jgi:HK97 family phage major capsid protein
MNELKKIGEELKAKRAQLVELGQKAKEGGYEAGAMDELRAKSTEVTELQAKYDAAATVEATVRDNDAALKNMNTPATNVSQGGGGGQIDTKSLGEMFTDTEAFKGYKKGSSGAFAVELGVALKTLLSTVNGFAPDNPRTNRIVESVQQRPTLASLIPSVNTNLDTIKYMEEVVYDNQTAAVAEGASLAESGFRMQEVSNTVKKIGTFIPVTEEQLADVPQVEAIINNRLTLMLQQREEFYLLNGTGAGAEIMGFFNKPGILTQALGADTRVDAVQKAIEKVETAGGLAAQAAIPTAVVMHPTRWGEILRAKDTDGRYIIGDPQSGAAAARLWGVPVVVTSAVPANTALVGDFRLFSQISRKMGMVIEAGYINDQFIQGVQSVKITERIALEIYRAVAFCQITGF